MSQWVRPGPVYLTTPTPPSKPDPVPFHSYLGVLRLGLFNASAVPSVPSVSTCLSRPIRRLRPRRRSSFLGIVWCLQMMSHGLPFASGGPGLTSESPSLALSLNSLLCSLNSLYSLNSLCSESLLCLSGLLFTCPCGPPSTNRPWAYSRRLPGGFR